MSGKRTSRSASSILDGACMDCGVHTMAREEFYMLRDIVWRSINPLVLGQLCLQCAEDRLGRPLHRGDFSKAPVNQKYAARCAALAERFQRPHPKTGGVARIVSGSAIQARLTRKKRTQSALGRLSAALLPYRGRTGRVPHGTLTRVLAEQVSRTAPGGSPRIAPTDRDAGSIRGGKRIQRRR